LDAGIVGPGGASTTHFTVIKKQRVRLKYAKQYKLFFGKKLFKVAFLLGKGFGGASINFIHLD